MKRKYLAVGIILLFVGTSIIPAIAQDTKKPSPTSRGNWLYVGGSGQGNYTRIQDAVDNASNGDTVFVFSGIYHERIHISKSINLTGEDPTSTIIDGTDVTDAMYETVYIHSENIEMTELSGFTIKNTKNIDARPRCIIIDGDNIEVHGNIITGGMIGIQSGFGTEEHIFRNTITNNVVGCFLYYAELSEVSENNFIGNFQQAVYLNSRSTLWDRNYWDNVFLKVKIIFGWYDHPIFIPSFNLDLNPAQEPYDIPGMS
jgi:hypothetical protein